MDFLPHQELKTNFIPNQKMLFMGMIASMIHSVLMRQKGISILRLFSARKISPNWKIKPLLDWMNYLFPSIWLLALSISINEMTMQFQGQHANKRRITYKNEGDGFQCDALCQEGFTYQIFMRNNPAPKKYLKLGLSLLHSQVMALFDT